MDGAEKSTETRQRWKNARRLPYICKNEHSRCRVVFLRFSSLPCFCTFFSSIPTWNEVLQKLFYLLSVLFSWFLNQVPNRRRTRYCAGDKHFWLETNGEEERKKEDEQNRIVSGVFRVDLAIEYQKNTKGMSFVSFSHSSAWFLGVAPIPCSIPN